MIRYNIELFQIVNINSLMNYLFHIYRFEINFHYNFSFFNMYKKKIHDKKLAINTNNITSEIENKVVLFLTPLSHAVYGRLIQIYLDI